MIIIIFNLRGGAFDFRNNECPACRTHCASRRSLRDDPNYDNLIAALYPDIDKYEQEVYWSNSLSLKLENYIVYFFMSSTSCWISGWLQELAFHEEEKNRNKQVGPIIFRCQLVKDVFLFGYEPSICFLFFFLF